MRPGVERKMRAWGAAESQLRLGPGEGAGEASGHPPPETEDGLAQRTAECCPRVVSRGSGVLLFAFWKDHFGGWAEDGLGRMVPAQGGW